MGNAGERINLKPKKQKTKIPFGIRAIIVLQFVSASVTIVTLSVNTDLLARLRRIDLGVAISQEALLFIIILIQVMIAIGLWRMQRWAWFVMMVFVGWSMAVDIWYVMYGQANYLGMLLNVIIVFYLNQRDVQRAFSRLTAEEQRK